MTPKHKAVEQNPAKHVDDEAPTADAKPFEVATPKNKANHISNNIKKIKMEKNL